MITIKNQEKELKEKLEKKVLLIESPENQRAKNIMDLMSPKNSSIELIENYQREKIKVDTRTGTYVERVK
jgi:hypothetical protein